MLCWSTFEKLFFLYLTLPPSISISTQTLQSVLPHYWNFLCDPGQMKSEFSLTFSCLYYFPFCNHCSVLEYSHFLLWEMGQDLKWSTFQNCRDSKSASRVTPGSNHFVQIPKRGSVSKRNLNQIKFFRMYFPQNFWRKT